MERTDDGAARKLLAAASRAGVAGKVELKVDDSGRAWLHAPNLDPVEMKRMRLELEDVKLAPQFESMRLRADVAAVKPIGDRPLSASWGTRGETAVTEPRTEESERMVIGVPRRVFFLALVMAAAISLIAIGIAVALFFVLR